MSKGHRRKLMRSMHKRTACIHCDNFASGKCGTCNKNVCRNCVALHFAKKHNKNNVHADKIHFPM